MVARVGPYEIHQSLGPGALGMVYRAVNEFSGDVVALKLVRKDVLSPGEGDDLLARYRRDVDLTSRLDHPHVLKALEAGETEDFYYLVTELVSGGRLADQPLGSLDLGEVLGWFLELLDALATLHGQGIVHRDINPIGLLITTQGGIKLSNFGVAQGGSESFTSTAVIGTPPYLAPEQILGVAVDGRADLYAAAASLFHAVTGRKPFVRPSLAETIGAILDAPPPLASRFNAKVPAALEEVLRTAMAKHPDDRYASAAEFAEALRQVAAQLPPTRDELQDEDLGEGPEGLRRRIHVLLVRSLEHSVSPHLDDLRRSLAAFLDLDPGPEQCRALAGVMTQAADALRDLILAHAPLPGQSAAGARSDWMDAVHLFDTLRTGLVRLGEGDVVAPMVRSMARDLTVTALLYLNEVNRQVFSPDHVELGRITANLIRLDVLEWALEVLNARDAVRDIRVSSRMIAGQVLRRVGATIRDFTEHGDDLARFDVASVLLATEELIDLADRAIQQDPESGSDSERSYAKVLGREIVADFIDAARRLTAVTADELISQIGDAGCDVRAFAAKLRQLGRLHQFSVRVEDDHCRGLAMRLTEDIRQTIDTLGSDVITALSQPSGADRKCLHRQLTAIHVVAIDQGWSRFAEDLLTVSRESLLQRAGA